MARTHDQTPPRELILTTERTTQPGKKRKRRPGHSRGQHHSQGRTNEATTTTHTRNENTRSLTLAITVVVRPPPPLPLLPLPWGPATVLCITLNPGNHQPFGLIQSSTPIHRALPGRPRTHARATTTLIHHQRFAT